MVENLVMRAKEFGMPAVAITDHGNMSGAIEFYKAAKEAGIKPIVGCEVYYVPDMNFKNDRDAWHLVLFAKNLEGYRNLMKITSAGYTEGFYYKPRVDLELISKHSRGLVAMTACVKGYVPAMILGGKVDEARVELGKLRNIFHDDLYIEVMEHGLAEQRQVNPELIKLGHQLSIPVLATNDCHYVNADDYEAHEVLLCIQTQKTLADADRLRFGSDQFYFKTQREMANLFPEECLIKTLEVAEKCNLELDLAINHMPEFKTPDGATTEDYLWERIQQGVLERYGTDLDSNRVQRLASEFDVINRTGFASYFLIIDDLIQFARRQHIRVGPGRGSAVASLVCYVLGITDVDPVKHNLMFERFLTEDRVSPPDIDVDFSHDRRDEIINYLSKKYGYTAQITTFSRLSPRSLIRDVGKALRIDKVDINAVADKIPYHTDKNLAELQAEIDELNGIDQKVIEIGTKLDGIIRHIGKHPAGIVVSSEPLEDIIPLCVFKEVRKTQYDKDNLEDCGMLKIDVLANSFLTAVDMTLEYLGSNLMTDDFPMDDAETFDMICSGEVAGIFQLSQECGRDLVMKMQPRTFDDLCHLISLGRPGVLDSGLAERYFDARNSGSVEYLHPSLEPILRETLGIILYQEQIIRIAVDIAGFSWTDADKLRKSIGKKDPELMASLQSQFVDGCVSNGIPDDTATALWHQVEYFGGYGFNKAHAAGYAKLTYWTAYLKAHYPVEYYASIMSVKANEEELRELLFEARRRGIEIRQPDINVSTDKCVIVDNAIHLPLMMVAKLADKSCDAIVTERKNGEFISYGDFCERLVGKAVDKTVRANLVKAGAFDSLQLRHALLGDSSGDILALEHKVLGLYISGHPLNDFDYSDGTMHIDEVAQMQIESEFKVVGVVCEKREHVDRNGGLMAFITIEDGRNLMEFVIFASIYDSDFEIGNILHIHGRLDQREPLKAIAIEYEILNPLVINCAGMQEL